MKEMKKILNKMSSGAYYPPKEEFQDMSNEDKELYLFLRGGFASK
ncbi:Uncharacterised protein [uncultured archaeon]|nr:Uncharacterised protein [uncultured archaeon]